VPFVFFRFFFRFSPQFFSVFWQLEIFLTEIFFFFFLTDFWTVRQSVLILRLVNYKFIYFRLTVSSS
jgi:hypothetical protein